MANNINAAEEIENGYYQFFPNCTYFTFDQLKRFNLAMGISGTVCLTISISILILLLCVLKAYKSTMQRLIIYNAVLIVLYQLGNVLQLEHQFDYNIQSTMCSILGAVYMYIANVTFTSSAVIITYLLYLVLYLYFKGSLPHSKIVNCVVELVCILIPFILPLLFLWTPFMHYGFGLGGFYCWIKDVDRNCSSIYTDFIIMYSVSEATSLEMLVSSAIVFIAYFRMRTTVKRRHINTLIQKTCFLISFHAVAFAVVTAAFGVIFYLLHNKVFSLNQPFMFSVAIAFPIIYEISLIAFFFVSLRTSNSKICARSLQQEPDHDILSSNRDLRTRPPRLSLYTQPSYTVSQSMPHTGGFDSDGEKRPILTSSTDHLNADYAATLQCQIPENH